MHSGDIKVENRLTDRLTAQTHVVIWGQPQCYMPAAPNRQRMRKKHF